MIRAVLFDLDDTLLGNPNHSFLPAYFQALTQSLDHLIPAHELLQHLLHATQKMIADTDATRTNNDVFWDEFLPAVGVPQQELVPAIDHFYTHEFPKLERFVQRRPEARATVQKAFDCGFHVVIATNPLYPRQAIVHRLEWAGVADFPYALITSAENMHFAKPQPAYYREIAARIHQVPSTCLMIGDDIDNDMVPAAQAGMRTFHIVNNSVQSDTADWTGSLTDVQRLLTNGEF